MKQTLRYIPKINSREEKKLPNGVWRVITYYKHFATISYKAKRPNGNALRAIRRKSKQTYRRYVEEKKRRYYEYGRNF